MALDGRDKAWLVPDAMNQIKNTLNREQDFETNLLAVSLDQGLGEITLADRDEAVYRLRFLKFWFGYPSIVFLTAVSVLDRFLIKMKVQRKYLQCLVVSCLYIAVKLGHYNIDTKNLVTLSQSKCSVKDMERMSEIVKQKLNLQSEKQYSVFDYLNQFLNLLETFAVHFEIKSLFNVILKRKSLLSRLEIIMCDSECASWKPTIITLALIQCEIERFFSNEIPSKSYYSLKMLHLLRAVVDLQLICLIQRFQTFMITMINNTTLKCPLFRDYVALTNLGSGHYAKVYKSFSKDNAQVVAVKVFTQTYNPHCISKINQEVSILKKLNHNNIVEFIDYIENDRFRYIVMEYCDRGTLKNLIHKNKRLSESLTRCLLQQLVRGLNYLNSMLICHMDLKPENLLLNSKPHFQLKIGDFGLSHDFTNSTITFKPAGTVGYMAPEKILGLKYGLISDLWSVGVIIRECVTGKHIFAGYTCGNIRKKVAAKSPIGDPTDVELSFHCIDLLRSLLQYEPNERLTLEGLNAHPFVDIKHEICAHSYQKAKEMIKNALKFDENFEYSKSVPLYKEVMQLLQAFASVEPDENKKAYLNMKLWEYERWIKIIQRVPGKQHMVVVQPLPDLNGSWYEIDKGDSSTSIPKKRDKRIDCFG